jgi:hypothetical protein
MWRTVVDTKQGRVWANHPKDQRMIVVADVEEDAEQYFEWNKMISSIRDANPEKVRFIYNVMVKNFEKMLDKNVKPTYYINSNRGNPDDL